MLKKFEKRGKLLLAKGVSVFLDKKTIDPVDLDKEKIDRLLVIRQHNQMGDMLLAVPAFRGLRKRFPDAEISLIAAPINTDVMINNPYLDRVFTYSKEKNRNFLNLISFIRALRKKRFDAVIVLNTVSFSITSMLLAVISGARIRIGSTSRPFGHGLSGDFYHIELPLPSAEELSAMHESEHNLYPLSAIGVRETDLTSLLVASPGEEDDCRSFVSAAFGDGTGYAVIHPGAGKKQNIWPPERFAALAGLLRKEYGLLTVAVSGPADGDSLRRFLGACEEPVPAVVSSAAVGFLGALMRGAAITVCNDTGVMHIAGAVGARCAAVFGPTDPARWKPVGENVVAVRRDDGDLEGVAVDAVMKSVAQLLAS